MRLIYFLFINLENWSYSFTFRKLIRHFYILCPNNKVEFYGRFQRPFNPRRLRLCITCPKMQYLKECISTEILVQFLVCVSYMK
jgi:hypothetical protein